MLQQLPHSVYIHSVCIGNAYVYLLQINQIARCQFVGFNAARGFILANACLSCGLNQKSHIHTHSLSHNSFLAASDIVCVGVSLEILTWVQI